MEKKIKVNPKKTVYNGHRIKLITENENTLSMGLKERQKDILKDLTHVDYTPEHSRVIKKYSNRKYYDFIDSGYISLVDILDLIRGGEAITIVDHTTKADITKETIASAINVLVSKEPHRVPIDALLALMENISPKAEEGGK